VLGRWKIVRLIYVATSARAVAGDAGSLSGRDGPRPATFGCGGCMVGPRSPRAGRPESS